MGLLDILHGMQNGPGGARTPTAPTTTGGSAMTPIMIALLGLLAYKAMSGSGQAAGTTPAQPQTPAPGGGMLGGLGGLGGLLGGLFGGSSAATASTAIPGGLGGVLSGGLGNIVKDLQNKGQGQAALSWVGTGPNQHIAPEDLGKAIGPEALAALTEHTGMNQNELLAGLSQNLPHLIDQLTPNGKLPTSEEAARMA